MSGGLGASRFSKGFKDALDLDFWLFLGLHTIPLITTPFTISSLVTVNFSDESFSEWLFVSSLATVFLDESSLATDPVLVTKLELDTELESAILSPGGCMEDGTFTHRLRR